MKKIMLFAASVLVSASAFAQIHTVQTAPVTPGFPQHNPALRADHEKIHADKEQLRTDRQAAKAAFQQLKIDRQAHNENGLASDRQRLQGLKAQFMQDREVLKADVEKFRSDKGVQ